MKRAFRSKLQGISLVELLVALALGLIISLAAVQMFLVSQTTYRMQDSMSRLQESGRFAIQYMSAALRMAGYNACGNLGRINSVNIRAKDVAGADVTPESLTSENAVVGTDNVAATNTWGAVAGTDVIVLQGGSNDDVPLVGNMETDNANIQIANNSLGLAADDLILITDCVTADLFRATNVSEGSAKVTIAHSSAGNINPKLSKVYEEGSIMMRYGLDAFYIGDTGRTTVDGDAVLALYVRPVSGTSFELVSGVEDMQLEYGVDTSGNQAADTYLTGTEIDSGATTWAQVVSVRLSLLLRSDIPRVVQDSDQDALFNGATETFTDGYLRQVFSTVVTIRNRVL